MSTTRIFTALLVAGAAVATPLAVADDKPETSIDLGPGIQTSASIAITTVDMFGDGCPPGSVNAVFHPETSSFNVTFTDFKAILVDNDPNDYSSCHLEIGLKTQNEFQVNLLSGTFIGSVYLEDPGMTALVHTSVSFAGNPGGTNIPTLFYGPKNVKSYSQHNLITPFFSNCSAGGDYLMLVDLVLHVARKQADSQADGFVDIDELTGGLSQAFVIKTTPCGQPVKPKGPPKTETKKDGEYDHQSKSEKKRGHHKKTCHAKKDDDKSKTEENGNGNPTDSNKAGVGNDFGHTRLMTSKPKGSGKV